MDERLSRNQGYNGVNITQISCGLRQGIAKGTVIDIHDIGLVVMIQVFILDELISTVDKTCFHSGLLNNRGK